MAKTADEKLQQIVTETSGSALTISPKDKEWSGYLLQQKKSFTAPTFPKLCEVIAEHIVANREETPSSKKPFKYKK